MPENNNENIQFQFNEDIWLFHGLLVPTNIDEIVTKDIYYFSQDVMQFLNKNTDIAIDVGVYNQEDNMPFVGYTIMVIPPTDPNNPPAAWDNPIETIVIMSSKDLKMEIERLLKKYKDYIPIN